VQSGSDRILAAMKRGHTVLEYKQKLRKLRAVRPDICISTDIIVGFPGETDEDFVATMNLVADVGSISRSAFIYSRRPGHAGGRAAGRGAARGQAAAARTAAAALERTGARHLATHGRQPAARAGRAAGEAQSAQLAGRTDNNRWVNFDGPATIPMGSSTALRTCHHRGHAEFAARTSCRR
jgi:tRNA-2-methylthio-N6-dimethylallyladenosine synthase